MVDYGLGDKIEFLLDLTKNLEDWILKWFSSLENV